jgi:hypothetical protein
VKTINILKPKLIYQSSWKRRAKASRSSSRRRVNRLSRLLPWTPPAGGEVRRLGFTAGQISVPDDFDQMGRQELERLFAGKK